MTNVSPNRAFEVEGLIINDQVGIFGGSEDPRSGEGQDAPVGSLYLRTNGDVLQKTGDLFGDWAVNQKGAGSQSASDSYDGNILISAINYNASNKVIILADTSINSVTIVLPDASLFIDKIFHIKWILGDNSLILSAQSGQTIDGEASHSYGELHDSLEVISTGNNWYII